jgi:phage shock protein PspC (stress-responsive transcriptional regulator)|tara:strand:- start:184 stop:360 length:177 start_codon:yes stop_codon:yes gene_type:complete
MGNSMKGVALIFELDQKNIQVAFDIGVEMGYFYQFGIFSYIMTAIINQSEKQKVKEHL